LWAGLSVGCTRGEEPADRVERDDLGATRRAGDPAAIAAALDRVLSVGRDAYAQRLAAAAAHHAWPRVIEPLERWLAGPPPAPPLGLHRALERRPSERMRTGAYLVLAPVLSMVGLAPPTVR